MATTKKRRRNEDGSLNLEGHSPNSAKIHIKFFDYVLPEPLGRGSQGCAYLVYTPTLGVCVLKQFITPIVRFPVSPEDAAHLPDFERGLGQAVASMKSQSREIKYTSEVDNHPNILRFYGYAVDETSIIGVITEYMSNGSLEKHFDNESVFTPTRILDWALQLARALSYCHEVHKIVHRDVKPENVLVSDDFHFIKLCDFGFARVVRPGEMTYFTGTLNYMAPEVMDVNSDYSYKADVWSYGMFLYAITHRKVPFGRLETNFVTLRNRLESGERPKVTVDPAIDELIYDVLEACWQRDPEQRPRMVTIVEMLDGLLRGPRLPTA